MILNNPWIYIQHSTIIMKLKILLIIIILITGCTPTRYAWVNDSLRGASSENENRQFNYDNTSCLSLTDSRYGTQPPNGSMAPAQNCSTSGGIGGAILCGSQMADADHQWRQARKNTYNYCMANKGWNLRKISSN